MNAKAKILDIAMNLNRIGNWAADDYHGKRKRILAFLKQTSEYINLIEGFDFSSNFKKTYERFIKEYKELEKARKEKPKDELLWAERMMTWGNILTHRAKLI